MFLPVSLSASPPLSSKRAIGSFAFRPSDSQHSFISVQNSIRQFTWRDYYFPHPGLVELPGGLEVSDVGARMHVDHCIEALRISLMSHGDTTPCLIKVDSESPVGSISNFSPHHKCVKFDQLVDYMEKYVVG
jgi:Mycotoxin biosynthesis protein UstYa